MRNLNSTTWLLFFAFIIIFYTPNVSAQQKSKGLPKTVVKPLPNLALNTISGQKWSLEENLGKVVLLNFWATWCAPCRAEVPYLVRLSKKYKASGLEVVGINIDSENVEQINNFIKEFKIDYPVLLTVPGSALSRQKAVPMSLLIDKKGILVKKYVGAIKESVFEKDIKVLFGEKSARAHDKLKGEAKKTLKRKP